MSDSERDRMVAVVERWTARPGGPLTDALLAAGFGDVTALRQNLEAQAESDNNLLDAAASLLTEKDAQINALAAQVAEIKKALLQGGQTDGIRWRAAVLVIERAEQDQTNQPKEST